MQTEKFFPFFVEEKVRKKFEIESKRLFVPIKTCFFDIRGNVSAWLVVVIKQGIKYRTVKMHIPEKIFPTAKAHIIAKVIRDEAIVLKNPYPKKGVGQIQRV